VSDQRFGTVQKYTSRPSGAWHGRWCYRDAADRKEAEEISDVVLCVTPMAGWRVAGRGTSLWVRRCPLRVVSAARPGQRSVRALAKFE